MTPDFDEEDFVFVTGNPKGKRAERVRIFDRPGRHRGPRPHMPPMPPMPPKCGHVFQFDTYGGSHGGMIRTLQKEKDDQLVLYIFAPGLKKDSIKLRAKEDFVHFSGEYLDELQEMDEFNQKELKIKIRLVEVVDPNNTKASYSNGIMRISMPIVQTGTHVEVE